MNKDRKFAIYGANNTDLEQDLRIDRCNDWHFDDRIGEGNQVGDWLYAGGQVDLWDRGHLVRRNDVGWEKKQRVMMQIVIPFALRISCPNIRNFTLQNGGTLRGG